MTESTKQTPRRLSKLLDDALAKPSQNALRYRPFEAALAELSGLAEDQFATKVVGSVAADLENRLGEVVGRGRPVRVISFVFTAEHANELSGELRKARHPLQDALRQGRFQGLALLWGRSTIDGYWVVDAILSRQEATVEARRLGEVLGVPGAVEIVQEVFPGIDLEQAIGEVAKPEARRLAGIHV